MSCLFGGVELVPETGRELVAFSDLTIQGLYCIFRYPMVSKPDGHGKDGNVVKRDFAEGLINYLMPDANKKDQWDMLQGIMGKIGSTSNMKGFQDIQPKS